MALANELASGSSCVIVSVLSLSGSGGIEPGCTEGCAEDISAEAFDHIMASIVACGKHEANGHIRLVQTHGYGLPLCRYPWCKSETCIPGKIGAGLLSGFVHPNPPSAQPESTTELR